jgi:2-oxoglutarate ferredoxin oxidoreductase subunit beta
MQKDLKTFKDIETVYCSGCFHGTINRVIGEAIDNLKLRKNIIGVNSQGCGSFVSDYMNLDFVEAPVGLAIPVAIGIKNVQPEKSVITYQGDGDILSFGLNELMHSASRGDKITVIMINNLVMAQSGGQMSSTSLLGQVTDTTPYGRSEEKQGKQIKIAEIISKLPGSAYVSRVSVDTAENVNFARKSIEDALLFQIEGKGFSFIEFISTCPTFWYKTPVESRKWLQEIVTDVYPLGLIKRTVSR